MEGGAREAMGLTFTDCRLLAIDANAVDRSLCLVLKTLQLDLNLHTIQTPATRITPSKIEGMFREDTEKLNTPYWVLL